MMDIDYKKLFRNRLDVVEDNGFFRATRVSDKQLNISSSNEGIFNSGVTLEFISNTKAVFFDFIIVDTNELIANFDVFINDNYVESVSFNTENRTVQRFQFITNIEGLKNVKIYLSHATCIKLNNFQIDDNSILDYINEDRPLLLCHGDSITQGYIAEHCKNTYPVQISKRLNMELLNQSISGFIHDYRFIDESLELNPSIIISAYGTNDWENISDINIIKENIVKYLKKLHDTYTGVPTFIITPIYRGSYLTVAPCGSFFDVISILIKESKKYDNFIIIDGLNLVPHEDKYYDESILHPTDEGFAFYSDNLFKIIKKTLDK
jgi:hypothetical protein